MTSSTAGQHPHGAHDTSGTIRRSVEIKGRTYQADLPASRSADGELVTHVADEREWRLWVARQIARSGDVTAEAFRHLRETVSPRAARFAEYLGVSAATLSRWENGTHAPNPFVFALLRAAVLEQGAWQRLVREACAMHAADAGAELEPLVRIETRWQREDGDLHCTAEAFMPDETSAVVRVTMRMTCDALDGPAELEFADQVADMARTRALKTWRRQRVREIAEADPTMSSEQLAARLAISRPAVLELARSAGVRLND